MMAAPRHGMRIKLPNLEKVLTATESVVFVSKRHFFKLGEISEWHQTG